MAKEPKLFSKDDKFAVGVSVGVGVITFLGYLCGKFQGRGEAYTHCSELLTEAAKEVSENLDQVNN
jgi:hypothetical protein